MELKIKDGFRESFIQKITAIIRYIGYSDEERNKILAEYRDKILFKLCDKFDNAA